MVKEHDPEQVWDDGDGLPLLELTETDTDWDVVTVTLTVDPMRVALTPVIAELLPPGFSIAATMLLNTLPIAGPSRARMIMTTIATKTRIRAYSVSPCPFLPARILLIIVKPPCIIKPPERRNGLQSGAWRH
jgi:hypothetical protein